MNTETTKDLIYIAAILLQAGVLVFFIRRAMKPKVVKKAAEIPGTEYERTRLAAIGVTEQQLSLDIPATLTKVYGVVMDWDMSGTTLTLTAYINGAASAFLSSGAQAMGSGKNPAVAEQAADFVQLAQSFLNRTMPVSSTGFPPPGTVRFYFLTNKGVYAGQELLAAIDENSSPWVPFFFRANMLIDEIKQGVA
jgi:hypothetical protein